MEKINVIDLKTNETFQLEIAHSPLINRNGYSENFLGEKVPFPKLSEVLEKERAEVYTNIGANGNKVLDYHNYSVVFSKKKRLPIYTAVNIVGKTNLMAMQHDKRAGDTWPQDKRIEKDGDTFQNTNDLYSRAKFERGHMVRFFDPAWEGDADAKKEAMADTFYHTNCCPQISYFNAPVWNYLEDFYMARAIFIDKKISVFTGPIFSKMMHFETLNIPLSFWKVVVYKDKTKGLQAMGFLMSQKKYIDAAENKQFEVILESVKVEPKLTAASIEDLFNKEEIISAKVSIKLIEEKTGIKFHLDDADVFKNQEKLHHEVLKLKVKDENKLVVEKSSATTKSLALLKSL